MEPFIGQLLPVCLSYAPSGWLICDGSLLPISQYQALFSLIGTTFGGDGVTNFAIPDLRGRVPVGATLSGGAQTLTPHQMGEKGGTETVTLTVSEMPAHNHTIVTNDASQTQNTSSQHYLGGGGRTPVYSGQPGTTMLGASAVSVSGGSQGHSNMQPYLGVNWIIAVNGIWPSRP
jgi:microcystin-dependent protein